MAFPDVSTLLDDFNRGGAVNGSTIWSAVQPMSANNWTIVTNAAAGPDIDAWTSVRTTADFNAAVGAIQIYVEATGGWSDNDKGFGFCLSNDGDGYFLGILGEGVQQYVLWRFDNDVPTELIAPTALPFTPVGGDLFGLEKLADGTINIWMKDGAAAWSLINSTNDTTYSTGGFGFVSFGFNDSVDGITNVWGGEVAFEPAYEQAKYRFFAAGDELPHFDPGTMPTIADVTGTADATAGTTISAARPPAWNAGDMIVWVVAKDDDATGITDTTGGLIPLANGNTGSGTDGVCLFVGYEIMGSSGGGGTRVFTGDSEEWQAFAMRIAAGTFDPVNPINALGTLNGATTGEAVVAGFTATRAGARVFACGAVDIDPMDATFSPSGWTDVADNDAGEVTAWIATRDAATTQGESVAGATFGINTSDANVRFAFAINAPLVADGRTPLAAVDTPVELEVDTDYGAQIRIENDGGGAGDDDYKWQYRLNGGTWTDISSSSAVIVASATADFANGADVPEYLGGAGSYLANNNAALDTTGALTLGSALGGVGAFESHLNFQVVAGDVADDDVIELRLVLGGGTGLDTYTVLATITVNKEGAEEVVLTPSPVVWERINAAGAFVLGDVAMAPAPVEWERANAAPAFAIELALQPSPVAWERSNAAPAIVAGDVALTPGPVELAWAVAEPSAAARMLTPAPVIWQRSNAAPSFALELVLTPAPVAWLHSVAVPALDLLKVLLAAPVIWQRSNAAPSFALDLALTPSPVQLRWAVAEPTVVLPGDVLTPAPVVLGWDVGAPAFVVGDLALTPSPIAWQRSNAAPSFALDLAVTPDPVVLVLAPVGPSFVLLTVLEPAPVQLRWTVEEAAFVLATDVSLTPAPLVWGWVNGTPFFVVPPDFVSTLELRSRRDTQIGLGGRKDADVTLRGRSDGSIELEGGR